MISHKEPKLSYDDIKLYLCTFRDLQPTYALLLHSQRTHDAKITSLWHQNDVATSFWRHNDVIIASCARWAGTCNILPQPQKVWRLWLVATTLTSRCDLQHLSGRSGPLFTKRTDGRLTARSHEVSMPRDSGLDLSNRCEMTCNSTAVLPGCLSNFEVIRSL